MSNKKGLNFDYILNFDASKFEKGIDKALKSVGKLKKTSDIKSKNNIAPQINIDRYFQNLLNTKVRLETATNNYLTKLDDNKTKLKITNYKNELDYLRKLETDLLKVGNQAQDIDNNFRVKLKRNADLYLLDRSKQNINHRERIIELRNKQNFKKLELNNKYNLGSQALNNKYTLDKSVLGLKIDNAKIKQMKDLFGIIKTNPLITNRALLNSFGNIELFKNNSLRQNVKLIKEIRDNVDKINIAKKSSLSFTDKLLLKYISINTIFTMLNKALNIRKEVDRSTAVFTNFLQNYNINGSVKERKDLSLGIINDIKKTTANLGLNPYSSLQQASLFMSARLGSNSLLEQKNILDKLLKLSAIYQLDEQTLSQAFKGYTDIIGKGKLETQELKLQLGQAMPGFSTIAYKSLGFKNMNELSQAMSKGIITAELFFNSLAKYIDTMPFDRIETTTSSINQLKVSFDDLMNNFTSGVFENALIYGIKMLNSFIKTINHFGAILPFVSTGAIIYGFHKLKVSLNNFVINLQNIANSVTRIANQITGENIKTTVTTSSGNFFKNPNHIIGGIAIASSIGANYIDSKYGNTKWGNIISGGLNGITLFSGLLPLIKMLSGLKFLGALAPLLANPVGLAIAGATVIGGGAYLGYKKYKDYQQQRDILNENNNQIQSERILRVNVGVGRNNKIYIENVNSDNNDIDFNINNNLMGIQGI